MILLRDVLRIHDLRNMPPGVAERIIMPTLAIPYLTLGFKLTGMSLHQKKYFV
jgi:hypothetical protein